MNDCSCWEGYVSAHSERHRRAGRRRARLAWPPPHEGGQRPRLSHGEANRMPENRLLRLQVFRRRLPGTLVGNDLVGNLLPLPQFTETSALDGADMNEDILTAVVRLDETKAFRRVEPFHCACRHFAL